MRVEAHKRLAGPLSTLSFVGIALVFALTGTFRRHGGLWRPLLANLCVIVLVALGLALDSTAVRDNALIPLIWLRAVLPAAVCAAYLFGPTLRDPLRLPPVVAGQPLPGS
jgi:lipopolysaccharide export system permease protein